MLLVLALAAAVAATHDWNRADEVVPASSGTRSERIDDGVREPDRAQAAVPPQPMRAAGPPGSPYEDAPGNVSLRISLVATPSTVAPGDAIDLLFHSSAGVSIGRIALRLRYDPSLLRLRAPEEIDYGNTSVDPANFAVDASDDGEIVVSADATRRGGLASSSRPLGIVQFEAISRGWAKVDAVASVVVDASGRMLNASLAPASVQVAIN